MTCNSCREGGGMAWRLTAAPSSLWNLTRSPQPSPQPSPLSLTSTHRHRHSLHLESSCIVFIVCSNNRLSLHQIHHELFQLLHYLHHLCRLRHLLSITCAILYHLPSTPTLVGLPGVSPDSNSSLSSITNRFKPSPCPARSLSPARRKLMSMPLHLGATT
jgi:hypothetical protein